MIRLILPVTICPGTGLSAENKTRKNIACSHDNGTAIGIGSGRDSIGEPVLLWSGEKVREFLRHCQRAAALP